jgi:tetratricopeptide (TPR) repeat protein
MEAEVRLTRLALCSVALIVVAMGSASVRAQDVSAQDKVVRLNKEAIEDVDNLEWDRAKKTLLDALIVAKKAGLEKHPIMARTYVHLGIVYVTGFKNREKAAQCFARAFEIQPDIKLSRSLATAEVNDVFGAARARPESPRARASLECSVARQTLVDQAVPVRCAPPPDLPVTRVFLLYREPIKQRFIEVEMKKTATGWFQGRIPERVIYGASLQYFVEGRDAAGRPIARNGDAHDPNHILIVKR